MRFVDSNVFVHAYLKPRRELDESEQRLKASAKKIVARINGGEKVMTSVVHLAEVANLLEDRLDHETSRQIIEGLVLSPESLQLEPVTSEDCLAALEYVRDASVGFNDSIARHLMSRSQISEIYSFDKDFDKFGDVTRLTS